MGQGRGKYAPGRPGDRAGRSAPGPGRRRRMAMSALVAVALLAAVEMWLWRASEYFAGPGTGAADAETAPFVEKLSAVLSWAAGGGAGPSGEAR